MTFHIASNRFTEAKMPNNSTLHQIHFKLPPIHQPRYKMSLFFNTTLTSEAKIPISNVAW